MMRSQGLWRLYNACFTSKAHINLYMQSAPDSYVYQSRGADRYNEEIFTRLVSLLLHLSALRRTRRGLDVAHHRPHQVTLRRQTATRVLPLSTHTHTRGQTHTHTQRDECVQRVRHEETAPSSHNTHIYTGDAAVPVFCQTTRGKICRRG